MKTLVLGGARSGKSAYAEALVGLGSAAVSGTADIPDVAVSAPAVSDAGSADISDATSSKTASSPSVCYVATARPWPGDTDFEARIKQHTERRPAHWRTEDQIDATEAIRKPAADILLVDDLGTWLTHTLDHLEAWDKPRGTCAEHMNALIQAVEKFPNDRDLILVTPEVGLGVIPEHPAGRLFRDEIGHLNQQLAQVCDQVFLVVAGIPLTLKS